MKPLISYYGGKQRMAPHLLPIIERVPHTVYVEPFAGGAALLFAKRRPATGASNYREVINDTNDLLITMYRVAVRRAEEFRREIDATLYSQADYRRAMDVCKDPTGHDELTIAWAVYINAQMSFAHKINGGWRAAVFSHNDAATWQNRKQRLPAVLRRLQGVYISSEDALRCIRRWDAPQTLFYLDPPYPGTHQGHYSGYTTGDWTELCAVLDTIQGSYVLSNYAQDVEPQSAQQRVEIAATSSAANGRDRDRLDNARTEIVWICDRSHGARHELRRHLRQMSLGV